MFSAAVLTGLCVLAPSAQAANWFALETGSAASSVEVDVGSLRWHGDRRELKLRISYPQSQRQGENSDLRYLLATLELSCNSDQAFWRSVSWAEARADGPSSVAQQTRQLAIEAQALIPKQTWATLRRSACVRPK